MSHLPLISWVEAMSWPVRFALLGSCLALNLHLFVKGRLKGNELWLDLFFRMLGNNYFCLFIFHRINLQIGLTLKNPEQLPFLAWVNWFLVTITFLIFLGAYLTRSTPVARANRLREILFPLISGTLPMVITESFSFNGYEFVKGNAMLTGLFKPLVELFPGYWSGPSIALILIGHSLALWAMLHLGRSFAIFTEVRSLVTSGPYRFVRHPLYVGENFAAIGLCYFYPSLFNIAIALTFLVTQRVRAHFEEQKFLLAVPEYRSYMERVGAYLPRLGRTKKQR